MLEWDRIRDNEDILPIAVRRPWLDNTTANLIIVLHSSGKSMLYGSSGRARLIDSHGHCPSLCARDRTLLSKPATQSPLLFELFRRAIAQCSHAAWELAYRQYRPLVSGWVARHPAFPGSGEGTRYFVNCAFDRMWSALTPDKFDLFPDLRSVLRYLQMCVHSAIVDHMRVREHEALQLDEQLPAATNPAAGSTVEGTALARLRREELWNYLNQRLKSEQERCVLYGTFVLALKPRELYAQYKGVFRNVQDVYRVKENVIVRLRRDSELKQFLDDA